MCPSYWMGHILDIGPGEVLRDPLVVLCPIFWKNCQSDFQSGCTSLQSHQQRRSVPLSPRPHQHLLSPEFFILAILICMRWNLSFVLICIALMIKDVKQFFRCFSAIRYSSGEKSLFSSEPHFYMGLFDFIGCNLFG